MNGRSGALREQPALPFGLSLAPTYPDLGKFRQSGPANCNVKDGASYCFS
jgi:hypothetical protein